MNSENQIWGLIWSSLQEVSLQGSQRQEVPLGRERHFLKLEKTLFVVYFSYVILHRIKIVIVNPKTYTN